jgi:hypothetical protein
MANGMVSKMTEEPKEFGAVVEASDASAIKVIREPWVQFKHHGHGTGSYRWTNGRVALPWNLLDNPVLLAKGLVKEANDE